jgi:hypothetical protein
MRLHSVMLKYTQGPIYAYLQYVLYMMLEKNVQHEAQTYKPEGRGFDSR